jgi:hypothetical protein
MEKLFLVYCLLSLLIIIYIVLDIYVLEGGFVFLVLFLFALGMYRGSIACFGIVRPCPTIH